ncbi:MAG: amino acid adenylation domain-containing protein, partial [Alistipes sp.]|nr:amino acid adenylation domain-containing protein [Alistipes sp.]
MSNGLKSTPLSQSQMGIYVESIQHPNSLVYHMPFLYTLDKSIDLERLRAAIYRVIEAHPAFYSYYTTDDNGEPLIVERKDLPIVVDIQSVADMDAMKHDIAQRFDLAEGRPVHIALYSGKEHNYMLFEVHHIVCDGASASILIDELDRAYRGEDIEPEDYTFYDVTAEELRLRAGSQDYDEARRWHEENFNVGDVDTQIIADRNDKEHRVVHAEYDLNLDLDSLRNLIDTTGVKPGTLFTSAFALLMSKFTGDDQVLFSTIWHGRGDKRMARTMGMFVKTLPVYYAFNNDMTIAELFAHGDKIIKGARKHSIFSFADANAALGIKSNYLFVYQGYLFNNMSIGGYPVSMLDLEDSATTEPLAVQIYQERDGSYRAVVEYFAHLYSDALIHQLVHSFEAILNSMKDGAQSINELSFITSEQEALLDSFNATERDYDTSKTILDYFAQYVAQTPDHPAVVYKDRAYSYREVDELSNKIAHRIHRAGLGRNDVVAVIIPRSEWMMIASLGVLKAGCGYEPLDPSYPRERLQFMTADAGVRMIIGDAELIASMELTADNILYTSDIASMNEPATPVGVEVLPSDLFIMLYTSGSTGVPKGCMIEHRNVLAFALSHSRICDIQGESRVAAYASYGFDASLMDTYGTIVSGATLHIIAEEIRLDFVALNDYFLKHRITTSFMTTQVGFQFATACESPYLKTLMVGGEKLASIEPPKGFKLFNAYGPTECCVYTNVYNVAKYEDNIPIGKALPNIKLYVVDGNGRRLPAGAVGELWVAGHQVSRGYLNREEQMAKVFTVNPFNDDDAYNRVYHTGDIVRYLTDGNVQFVGRRDGQVKIRGFRIELKEIESIIRQYPDIRDVTVQAFDEEGGGKYVAAYIVGDKEIDIRALNDFILEEKPPYMVPAVTMQIERIPLTQNHKVDKRALPKPERQPESLEVESNVPMNLLERELHAIIAGVLNTEQFGVTTPLVYVGL